MSRLSQWPTPEPFGEAPNNRPGDAATLRSNDFGSSIPFVSDGKPPCRSLGPHTVSQITYFPCEICDDSLSVGSSALSKTCKFIALAHQRIGRNLSLEFCSDREFTILLSSCYFRSKISSNIGLRSEPRK